MDVENIMTLAFEEWIKEIGYGDSFTDVARFAEIFVGIHKDVQRKLEEIKRR